MFDYYSVELLILKCNLVSIFCKFCINFELLMKIQFISNKMLIKNIFTSDQTILKKWSHSILNEWFILFIILIWIYIILFSQTMGLFKFDWCKPWATDKSRVWNQTILSIEPYIKFSLWLGLSKTINIYWTIDLKIILCMKLIHLHPRNSFDNNSSSKK